MVGSAVGSYCDVELPLFIISILLGDCYFFHKTSFVVILAIFRYFCNSVGGDGNG